MTSRVIDTDGELESLIAFVRNHKRPFTVNITAGRKRSDEQNRLQFLWFREVAEQKGDETPTDVRAYCKLHFGVPMLRAENDDFREKYDAIIKPHSYEDKLAMMVEPLDFPISRLMTVEQHARYLDAVLMHWLGQGYKLTLPEEGHVQT
jgi:hypothetical protein